MVRDAFDRPGGLLRTGQALRAGIHPRDLYRLRDEGTLEQVSRGLYRLADLPPLGSPDLVAVALRVPKAAPKPAPKAPADLLAALARNRKAKATFDAFPPSHRREYVEWIVEAKRPETRARRLETAIEWMAAGKARDWKYAR